MNSTIVKNSLLNSRFPEGDAGSRLNARHAATRPHRLGSFALRCFAAAITVALIAASQSVVAAEELPAELADVLERAGKNRTELLAAWQQTPEDQREGMRFLLVHMPASDLKRLSSKFLREHVEYGYRAWRESPWKAQIPKAIFLNNILPYCSIDERRDAWRQDFFEQFRPLVADAESPREAATILNRNVFPLVNVKYSRRRPKANQSPYESIEAEMASCSGLSVLLIDACRAVGVPARFVGIPLWADRSGNHSWVEIWDQQWHFTGAAEPTGNQLNKAWFVGRASQAKRDNPRHAIYATSYRETPLHFPLVWDLDNHSVHAVNVTDRYTRHQRKLPPGCVEAMFRVLAAGEDQRVAAEIRVSDPEETEPLFTGKTKDERFDGNDHLRVPLPPNQSYRVLITYEDHEMARRIEVTEHGQLFSFTLPTASE